MVVAPYLTFNKSLSSALTVRASEFPEGPDTVRDLPLEHRWTVWRQQKEDAVSNYSVPVNARDYKDSMKPVVTISSVAEFWRTFSFLPQPSDLLLGTYVSSSSQPGSVLVQPTTPLSVPSDCTSFMFFREGVRPEWEDPLNTDGGHFQFCLSLSSFERSRHNVLVAPNHQRQTTDKDKENSEIAPLTSDEIAAARLDEYWNNLVLSMIGNSLPHSSLITGIRLVDKTKLANPAGLSPHCSTPSPSPMALHCPSGGEASAAAAVAAGAAATAAVRPAGHVRVELWFSAASETAVSELRRAVEFSIRSRFDGTVSDYPMSVRIDTRHHLQATDASQQHASQQHAAPARAPGAAALSRPSSHIV